jgi:hypothetical protein
VEQGHVPAQIHRAGIAMKHPVIVAGARRQYRPEELAEFANYLAKSAQHPGLTNDIQAARLEASRGYSDEAIGAFRASQRARAS